ncbi:MAG TPA: 2,3-bisphosphoglycerate-independent phosphoglycerate mutase, partial [Candidatus Hydrogenedentes bacterium]|nr:2,3-bisphosphoglycerate-independent phosphoglycerate mutase [Candidatus Hydrogenedentota bacterium]
MKYIILLGDGMADHPLEACGGKTPLEAADTPNMDRVARTGCSGLFCPIPEGMPAGSDVGNISMFGYDPRVSFSGRAAIEAANQGIMLADNEVAFRCNLVTLADGIMRDFTSGHISTEEAHAIITTLNDTLARAFPITFHTGVSYRHTGVVKATADCSVDDLVNTVCEPPHNISDQQYEPYLPAGPAQQFLRGLMAASQKALAEHPVNQARRNAAKSAATSLWPWGQGKAPALESFKKKFGLTGAVVSAVDLVKGIGVCAGLEALSVPGATGWIDTNYEGKVDAALDALNRHDFVYLHLEAPDEAAHQG